MRRIPMRLLRYTALALSCSIFATSAAYAADVALTPATAKQMLQTRGVGKMVKVQEADGTVLRAKIVAIDETSVRVQDGSKPIVEIPYDKVAAVKGPGLSKGAKIGIGVGAAAVVTVAIIVAYAATHVLNGLKF